MPVAVRHPAGPEGCGVDQIPTGPTARGPSASGNSALGARRLMAMVNERSAEQFVMELARGAPVILGAS